MRRKKRRKSEQGSETRDKLRMRALHGEERRAQRHGRDGRRVAVASRTMLRRRWHSEVQPRLRMSLCLLLFVRCAVLVRLVRWRCVAGDSATS